MGTKGPAGEGRLHLFLSDEVCVHPHRLNMCCLKITIILMQNDVACYCRKALLSLRLENEELRSSVGTSNADEETHRRSDKQRGRGVQWQPEPCEGKKRCSRVLCLDSGAQISYSTQVDVPQRPVYVTNYTQVCIIHAN